MATHRVQIEGGWREVEFAATAVLGQVLVRDAHRGTYHWVEKSALVPIVPRSEWETA